VKNGATTIWERWDGWTPDKGFQTPGMNSFNHYAYGAVCDWLVGAVAGLEPAEPGYRRIRFKPRPGGSLTHASASLETRYGKVAIAWTLEQEQLRLRLTVPPGTTATLDLSGAWQGTAVELAAGTHTHVFDRKNIE
jgi:alpha-L-rhamnosidase